MAARSGSVGPIGVLALQGDFQAHIAALEACGAETREIRLPEPLEACSGLIIPGGESTVLLRLMRAYGLDIAIPRFFERGGAIFGTCAGAILMARSVTAPEQWSMGLLDIDVERNAYGRQIESFETILRDVDLHPPGSDSRPDLRAPVGDAGVTSLGATQGDLPQGDAASETPGTAIPAVFIRAPRIRRAGPGVRVLAERDGEPVLVSEGRLLAATFHPELTGDLRIHRHFLAQTAAAAQKPTRSHSRMGIGGGSSTS